MLAAKVSVVLQNVHQRLICWRLCSHLVALLVIGGKFGGRTWRKYFTRDRLLEGVFWPGSFLISLEPTRGSGALLSHTLPTIIFCLAKAGLRAMEPADHRLKPWAKINFSSFKLFFSDISSQQQKADQHRLTAVPLFQRTALRGYTHTLEESPTGDY